MSSIIADPVLAHTMPRSPRSLAQRIQSLDITCNCRTPLVVSCTVGTEQGCRERRRYGTCPCRPRWLPVCLLDSSHGCAFWREGKVCDCDFLEMPRCLSTGCDERRKGHRCECPRTPAELCPHVRAKIAEFASLTVAEANRFADAWADQLWTWNPQVYADRPLAHAGCEARAGEAAVNVMIVRRRMGLSLWHPEDHRWAPGELGRRQAAGLRRLFLPPVPPKGGAA